MFELSRKNSTKICCGTVRTTAIDRQHHFLPALESQSRYSLIEKKKDLLHLADLEVKQDPSNSGQWPKGLICRKKLYTYIVSSCNLALHNYWHNAETSTIFFPQTLLLDTIYV